MQLQVLDVKLRGYHSDPIYLESTDLDELSRCPACASAEQQRHIARSIGTAAEGLRTTHCGACGHAYLSRRPIEEWFQRYYATEWDTHRAPGSRTPLGTLRGRLQRMAAARRVVHAVRVLRWDLPKNMYPGPARLLQMVAGLGDVAGDRFPAGRKLLEIGSGYGAALSFFRDAGLEVYGTEASRHRVAACRAQGLRVEQTSILDLEPVAAHAPYDFVYSSHVFEHLTDLDRLMLALVPLVADRGFVYIEVPHSPLAEDIVLRSHIPVHLHMFSAESLIALLRRHGLEPVRILADLNLHVVAQKSDTATPVAHTRIPAEPEALAHGLEVMAASEPADFLVQFDQYRVDITRVDDGRPVFNRVFPYGNLDSVDGDRNQFVLRRRDETDTEVLPLTFAHATPRPPIWVK